MEKTSAPSVEQLINKKLVFKQPFEFDIETVNLNAEPDDNGVLIKTQYTLISSGTELALFTGTHVGIPDPNNTFAKYPFYPGYTVVGDVVAVGRNVKGYAVGDKVYTVGKHATYNVTDFNSPTVPLIKLPNDFVWEKVPFAKLGAICMTAIVQTRIGVGDNVVVLGMGLIGNIAAQLYSLMGANVIAVDLVEKRLQVARQTGIENVILSGDNIDLHEKVREITGGAEADIVVEATGSPKMVVPALDLVRKLGQVILLGATRGHVDLNVYEYIQRKGVHFIGALEGLATLEGFPSRTTLTRHILKLIELDALKIDPLLTHKLPYYDAIHAYDMLKNQLDQALGVLLSWED